MSTELKENLEKLITKEYTPDYMGVCFHIALPDGREFRTGFIALPRDINLRSVAHRDIQEKFIEDIMEQCIPYMDISTSGSKRIGVGQLKRIFETLPNFYTSNHEEHRVVVMVGLRPKDPIARRADKVQYYELTFVKNHQIQDWEILV